MSAAESDMDVIYNEVIANEKMKVGTKYERLAALVFKLLAKEHTVIHDLRLRGKGKKAQHQIDVTVSDHLSKKRVLIECKDFDSDKVGIGIVRDFFGAVHQIAPDEAFVVTTNGFTREAKVFAADEKIKLAILRAYDAESDGAYLSRIILDFHIFTRQNVRVREWLVPKDVDLEAIKAKLTPQLGRSEVVSTRDAYFCDANGVSTEPLESVLGPLVQQEVVHFMEDQNKVATMIDDCATVTGSWHFDTTYHITLGGVLVPTNGVHFELDVQRTVETKVIGSASSIKTLVMKTLDGSLDKVFTKDELGSLDFDSEGKVIFRKG